MFSRSVQIVVIALSALLVVSLQASAQELARPEEPVGTFGFGLESTGSACCISVRFWLGEERGSEMVLNAYDTHLFITLRGLQTLIKIEPVTAYAGVGLTLRLGDLVAASPFSAFMAMQGFVALETPVPFYEALIANLETSLEIRPPFGFSTAIGIGVHFYF